MRSQIPKIRYPIMWLWGVIFSKFFDLLVNLKSSVDGEIQLTDAIIKLLSFEGLRGFKTDAAIYDCGNKLGFLNTNLAVGV